MSKNNLKKDLRKCEYCGSDLPILKHVDDKLWEVIGMISSFPNFFIKLLEDTEKKYKKQLQFHQTKFMLRDELTLIENRLRILSIELDTKSKLVLGEGDKEKKLEVDLPAYKIKEYKKRLEW